ncbi:MAG: DUF805 domain-containing protein [Prochlorococcus sp.]|jgi:uncharacterized membrane protein YhaH (DUF805 family)|tara:strand:- start:102 stop:476 length:375 start_codon:yes stop_codon:yes gene_type:complete
MQIISAYRDFWQKAFDYKGRTSRIDLWLIVLAGFIVSFVIWLPFGGFWAPLMQLPELLSNPDVVELYQQPAIITLWAWVNVIPTIPLYIRRMRDIGKHWAWIFIIFIPLIGPFWFLYLLLQPSK